MINFILLAAIGGYAAFVIAKRVKDKKNGKSACGCGGGCSSCSGCHMSSMEPAATVEEAEEEDSCCCCHNKN